MRLMLPLVMTLVLPLGIAQAQDDPLAGFAFNEHVLSDGNNAHEWVTTECEVQGAMSHAREGAGLQMHIPVDHTTGEVNYPIGWPRMYLPIPEDQRNWSGYDFISVWIYADTSRDKLPGTPLGMIVRCPDRDNSHKRSLTELTKGEWSRIVTPISELPNSSNCTSVQFYISESSYDHGDTLDFYIDDLKLLAYAAPVILELRPLTGLMYADASSLRVQARIAGLAADIAADLTCVLKRGDAVLAEENLAVTRGMQSFLLNFGRGALELGECTLEATIEGSDRVVTVPIHVVTSPWE